MQFYIRNLFLFVFIVFQNFSILSQEINQKLYNHTTKEEILIGRCTREAFTVGEYKKWFHSGYNDYDYLLERKILDSIKSEFGKINITIILGTWCQDSREQVPRFFKIMDYLDFDKNKITLICVDRNKEASTEAIDNYNVVLVPTFIIYRNEDEIGRIIESPKISLEKDLYQILKNPSKGK